MEKWCTFSAQAQVQVVIGDKNDNPPIFEKPLYETDVFEQPPDSSKSVIRVHATDRDDGKWPSPHNEHWSSSPRPVKLCSDQLNFHFLFRTSYIKINSRIWFGLVNSNFHFEGCKSVSIHLISHVKYMLQTDCIQ